jgi:hypothetical protein
MQGVIPREVHDSEVLKRKARSHSFLNGESELYQKCRSFAS